MKIRGKLVNIDRIFKIMRKAQIHFKKTVTNLAAVFFLATKYI